MICSKCSSEVYSDVVCVKCSNDVRQNILKSLEEFVDTNYPISQYKVFNARIKSKIKEIAEGN